MTDARRIEQTFIPGPSIQLGNGEIIELSWQERALCAQTDPEAFFPEKGGSTREAKRVCLSCEVRQECLEYALDQLEFCSRVRIFRLLIAQSLLRHHSFPAAPIR